MHHDPRSRLLRQTSLLFLGAGLAALHTGRAETTAAVDVGSVSAKATAKKSVKKANQTVDAKATQSRDIITSQQLKNTAPTADFLQGLRFLPNVDVYDTGGGGINGSSITINGFDQSRLNFALDGIPLNDSDSYSFYSNEFVTNGAISSITVDPGAGSATTVGLSAFGGSVGVATANPDPHFYVEPTFGYGSYDTSLAQAKINSGLFLKDVAPTSFYVLASNQASDNFFDRAQTDFKNLFLFKSVTAAGRGALTLFFSQNHQRFHYYGGCTQSMIDQQGDSCNRYNDDPTSTSYTGYEFNRYLNYTTYADYSLPLSWLKLDEKLYAYRGNGFGGSAYFDKKAGQLLFEPSWNITHRVGNILKANANLARWASLESGIWYQLNRAEHYQAQNSLVTGQEQGRVYDEFVRTQTLQPYVQFGLRPWKPLRVNLGVKYLIVDRSFDDLNNSANDRGARYRQALPSLGLNYAFGGGFHAFANYTWNARPPGYNQFYTGSFNQNLALEKAQTYSVGAYIKRARLEGKVSAFYTRYQNYILSLQVPDPRNPANFINQVTNAGNASYRGATASLSYQLLPWLSGFANAGVLSTRLDKYDGPAQNAPNQTQALGLQASWHGWEAFIAARRRGRRFASYLDAFGSSNTFSFYRLPSITTLDASVAWSWKNHAGSGWQNIRRFTARLNVTNLTDVRDPTSAGAANYSLSNPYLYLNTPIQVMGSVSARFF